MHRVSFAQEREARRQAPGHEPDRHANCTYCHDPHVEKKNQHGLPLAAGHAPYIAGDCNSCHATKQGGALQKKVPLLCYDCHDDVAGTMKKPHVHAAMSDPQQCPACHGPHGGAAAPALPAGAAAAVLRVSRSEAVPGQVPPPALDKGCTSCHDPHASDSAEPLKDTTYKVCSKHDVPHRHVEALPSLQGQDRSAQRPGADVRRLPFAAFERLRTPAAGGSRHRPVPALPRSVDGPERARA